MLPDLVRLMQEGKSFSTATAMHPACFSPLFIAMMAASEQTGSMAEALERYLQYHAQVSAVRQKLISASLYPALLMLTGTIVAFFPVWFLAPRFAHVYEGMTPADLPVLRVAAEDRALCQRPYARLPRLPARPARGSGHLLVRPAVQQRCPALFARIGLIGETLTLMQLARFYRSLGMLQQGGVALLPSLDMTRAAAAAASGWIDARDGPHRAGQEGE